MSAHAIVAMSANEPLVREAISQEPAFRRALKTIDAALESRVHERERPSGASGSPSRS